MRRKMNKDLKNPEILTKEFLEIMQGFLDEGIPHTVASLSAALAFVYSFTGKEKLEPFELDYYSKIITSIVDGVLFQKN
jgi:hypothetical protein